MTEAAIVTEELATIKNYLKAAEDVLASGYMPDITALGSRVAQLCERIQKGSKDVHEKCIPQLIALVEQLNQCEEKIRAFHATRTASGNAS